jgi:hypothetical protein
MEEIMRLIFAAIALGAALSSAPALAYDTFFDLREVWGQSVRQHQRDEALSARSEERRVGKECRRLCRSRWSPYH